MRRRLVGLVAAAATMVAVAFVVPLAALVSGVAHDRAIIDAERDVQLVVAGLAVSREPTDIELVITRTRAGAEGRLGVHFGGGDSIGAAGPDDGRVDRAFSDRRSETVSTDGGAAVIVPVAIGSDTLVVRADVGESTLRAGVRRAWLWLGVVGVLLVGGSVIVTDRLARSLTRPMAELESVSRRLAAGDLSVRAHPSGPPETAELAKAFNHLATRVDELLLAEREDVADLAHRLRTPLTALRLRLELLDDEGTRGELAEHADRIERAVTELISDARHRSESTGVATDVGAVVRQRVEWWSALADDVGMQWHLHIEPDLPEVVLRHDEFEAALDVLIENVFTHAGGQSASFEVVVGEGGVRLRCDDDGPGIESGVVARGTSTGSTGLGLDIARRFAESSGGHMSVGANESGGGRIELWLPA